MYAVFMDFDAKVLVAQDVSDCSTASEVNKKLKRLGYVDRTDWYGSDKESKLEAIKQAVENDFKIYYDGTGYKLSDELIKESYVHCERNT